MKRRIFLGLSGIALLNPFSLIRELRQKAIPVHWNDHIKKWTLDYEKIKGIKDQHGNFFQLAEKFEDELSDNIIYWFKPVGSVKGYDKKMVGYMFDNHASYGNISQDLTVVV